MRLLLFLSRVALICNLFSLLTVILQWKNFIGEERVVSTIIIMGYFLAVFVFNPLVHFLSLVFLLFRGRISDVIPRWLIAVNFIFLLLQITYILFLNDTLHT